jgi:alkyldihydroxyacetonephosphate synthase
MRWSVSRHSCVQSPRRDSRGADHPPFWASGRQFIPPKARLIEGGTYGPALEAQLRPHGLRLRHFPQSFEYSTLGGWIATRGGGHFATLYTHIDDFVESCAPLPGSGAGPSPDRLMVGSEGILGVITQAWMRLQDRPKFRDGGAVRFRDFYSAAR